MSTMRAVAVVVDHRGLLVIHRRRDGERYCVLPGGGVEPGEQPEQAALRELAEETSLIGRLLRPLGTVVHADRTARYFLITVDPLSEPRLGDGPERDRRGPVNGYRPGWIDPHRLAEHNLQPADIRSQLNRWTRAASSRS